MYHNPQKNMVAGKEATMKHYWHKLTFGCPDCGNTMSVFEVAVSVFSKNPDYINMKLIELSIGCKCEKCDKVYSFLTDSILLFTHSFKSDVEAGKYRLPVVPPLKTLKPPNFTPDDVQELSDMHIIMPDDEDKNL